MCASLRPGDPPLLCETASASVFPPGTWAQSCCRLVVRIMKGCWAQPGCGAPCPPAEKHPCSSFPGKGPLAKLRAGFPKWAAERMGCLPLQKPGVPPIRHQGVWEPPAWGGWEVSGQHHVGTLGKTVTQQNCAVVGAPSPAPGGPAVQGTEDARPRGWRGPATAPKKRHPRRLPQGGFSLRGS